eukprot:TRINITY_DN65035_c0_g2_i1.p1 TRINITY_DN65035_c0_g2~~TRINITY_DN65035_c0_g2_i1.p1  ORF type:complete len:456 (-),score=83.74 TRINITY_DN65035_c0_g2_i1:123-1490(-)
MAATASSGGEALHVLSAVDSSLPDSDAFGTADAAVSTERNGGIDAAAEAPADPAEQSPTTAAFLEAAGPAQDVAEAETPLEDIPPAVGEGHDDTGRQRNEMQTWGEMFDHGLARFRSLYPDRFARRVRRGIPAKYRWQVWKFLADAEAEVVPESRYAELSSREQKWSKQIRIDMPRTFPDMKGFDAEQQQRLFRILNAYASFVPETGYCQGMNYVAGLLLLVSNDEVESFTMMVRLFERLGLHGFYANGLPLLRRYLCACDRMLEETVPQLREHFSREGVKPAVYLHQWFLTLFINCFPLTMVHIIWDVIMLEGLQVILRITMSILEVLKDSLLEMPFEEVIRFFKMMKCYKPEDNNLSCSRIGELLVKHTEHIVIPRHLLEYLNKEPKDEFVPLDGCEDVCEAETPSGTMWQTLSRMFAFTGRSGSKRSTAAPEEEGRERSYSPSTQDFGFSLL